MRYTQNLCCFGISAFSEFVFTQCHRAEATQGNIHSLVSFVWHGTEVV